ncbi:hypothetical protein CsSME_00051339 [Camellia sinensis var. sinensis]
MDEELQKRNTDCVYFLASPLTCKKVRTTLRHCKASAKLSFFVSMGLNVSIDTVRLRGSTLEIVGTGWQGAVLIPLVLFDILAFVKHSALLKYQEAVMVFQSRLLGVMDLPLDAHTEVSSESAPPQNRCSAPVNKVNVPCYFYFNGFCNKGDGCSFLHGPDDGIPAWKSSRTDTAVSDAPPLENKMSAGSDTGTAPIETRCNPSEAAPTRAVEIQIEPKEDVHLPALGNIKDQSASPHLSASECEEAAAVRSETLILGKGLIQSRSLVCTDQSSDEQVDDYIEQEDWLESSPGFDVLVDNRSENLGYEEDPEYLIAIDRDGRELNGHFLGYDYEDPVEYDPAYPDAGILDEHERLDSSDQFDNEQRFDYIRKVPGRSREKMFYPVLPRKRKFLPVDMAIDGRRGMDLRDHLRKRRVINGRQVTSFSRRNNSSRQVDQSQERSRRHGTQWLHGRLITEENSNGHRSHGKNGTLLNSINPQSWFRQSRSNKVGQHYKEKRQPKQQFHSSEVSRNTVSKKKRSAEESDMFTGPKTLAQIKEEKRKATGNGDSSGKLGHSSRAISEEFQGPKPLSEILKDKRKLRSIIDANNDSS